MKKLFKWVGVGFALLVVLAVAGIMLGTPKKAQSAGDSSASTPTAPEKPPIAVTALQLFRDYDDNEVAADQKYKGKRLSVTGTIQSIDKDAFNNIVVHLRTSNEFMAALASLDDEHEQLVASLKKGGKVNWVCEGGGRLIGSPVLRKCSPS